ncbi:MAG: FecR domain-containing protein [Prevotella sp.]|nr:FecR domain-containing protein [Prevotella sp.]
MNENISFLICKRLVGSITPEEQQELDEWRQQNRYNEAVYQRLNDPERLLVEHHRDQLTDYERPLADMKQRLNIGRHRPWRYWVAAAVVVGLIAGAGIWWQRSIVAPTEELAAEASTEILPGRTQAILTLSSGETIELRNDTLYPRPRYNEPTMQANVPELATLTTPRGGEFRVVLEDGTEVWLNAESRLSYPEVFDGKERRVQIEGEAYFKVAKNEEKPFIVNSGGQEIRVYGTEFNVHAYSDEADVYTTLVKGSISLRPVNGNQSELMLTPGKQAIFDKAEETARVVNVDTEVVTSWRSGVIVFEDQTMEQIMRTLSRWYDFDYEFLDRQTAETVFMGSIPKYGTFDEVCDIFHKLGGIRLHQQGRKVIISAK